MPTLTHHDVKARPNIITNQATIAADLLDLDSFPNGLGFIQVDHLYHAALIAQQHNLTGFKLSEPLTAIAYAAALENDVAGLRTVATLSSFGRAKGIQTLLILPTKLTCDQYLMSLAKKDVDLRVCDLLNTIYANSQLRIFDQTYHGSSLSM